MLGERIEFAGNVADPIPEALLERPAELFGNALDSDENFVRLGRECRVAGNYFGMHEVTFFASEPSCLRAAFLLLTATAEFRSAAHPLNQMRHGNAKPDETD